MRRFYETWKDIEPNSVVGTTEIADDALKSLPFNSVVGTTELQSSDNKGDTIQGLRLTKDDQFPIVAFLNISFTHHVAIMRYANTHGARNDVNRGLQSLRAPLLVFITNTQTGSDPLVSENSEDFLFFLA